MRRVFIVTLLSVLLFSCGGGGGSDDGGDQGSGLEQEDAQVVDSVADQSDTPVRLAFADNQSLLFSDYQARAIQTIDSQTLTTESSIPIDGNPLAVGFHEGKIFVGNETSGCVEVYNRSGEKLYDLGDGPGSVPVPNDLAIDSENGRVYVVDSIAQRIAVFSVDGPFLYAISDPALIKPNAVALDEAADQLYISDCGSGGSRSEAAVLIFSADGGYVDKITGNFSWPQGLAYDGDTQLFLADVLLGQVLVFDLKTGQEIGRLGDTPTYAGPHKFPLDVVFEDVSRQIYVTDYLLGRIEQFSTAEIAP